MDKIDIYFKKGNFHHHLYLIEGDLDITTKFILSICEDKENSADQNSKPNYFVKKYEKFLIDDARTLKNLATFKNAQNQKYFFIISIGAITLEAQNSLLKTLEEPVSGYYYFLIFPTLTHILETVKSRAHILEAGHLQHIDLGPGHHNQGLKIIKSNFAKRQQMVKDFAKQHEQGEVGREFILNCIREIIVYFRQKNSHFAQIERLTEIGKIAQKPEVGLKVVFEAVLFLTPYEK